ncbi:MAG TPA: FadR family transcriptional regulator, partial [Candidatus Omnitrophica bacterium]|nr:FadR family transcriptional regulator [Candidatus Omnitrophota bacterium]
EKGYFKVGDKLPPERRLCEEFGVSRTALREGISSLVHLEVLETITGSGVYVRRGSPEAVLKQKLKSFQITKENISSLIDFREGLESFTGELVCRKATPEDIRNLEKLVNRMEKFKERGSSFAQEDVEFHKQLVLASHNEFVFMVLEAVIPFILRWVYARENVVNPEDVVLLHRRITERIKEGDSEGTRKAIKEHFQHTHSIVQKVWK